MVSLILALFLPRQFEGRVKACLSRTVAIGRTWSGLQLVACFIPYRPNRIYYRLAIGRV